MMGVVNARDLQKKGRVSFESAFINARRLTPIKGLRVSPGQDELHLAFYAKSQMPASFENFYGFVDPRPRQGSSTNEDGRQLGAQIPHMVDHINRLLDCGPKVGRQPLAMRGDSGKNF